MDKSRAFKPTHKAWLILFQVKLQHTNFNNLFRASNATRKILISHLGVRNQVTDCCLKFTGFKTKKG